MLTGEFLFHVQKAQDRCKGRKQRPSERQKTRIESGNGDARCRQAASEGQHTDQAEHEPPAGVFNLLFLLIARRGISGQR